MKPKWIVRIILGVVLLVLLVLGGMDFLAKRSAQETVAAWEQLDINNLYESELEAGVAGDPDIDSEKVDEDITRLTYTWSGTLRDYRIEVDVSEILMFDDDRLVTRFNGPLDD